MNTIDSTQMTNMADTLSNKMVIDSVSSVVLENEVITAVQTRAEDIFGITSTMADTLSNKMVIDSVASVVVENEVTTAVQTGAEDIFSIASTMADTLSNKMVIDSVASVVVENEVITAVQTRAEDIFGITSTMATPEIFYINNEYPWTDNIVFQSIALLLFVLYFTILYKNMGEISLLFSNLTLSKGSKKTAFSVKSGYRHTRFLSAMQLMGFVSTGLCAVKYAEITLSQQKLNQVPDEIIPLLVPIVIVISILVVAYQLMILNVAAWVTLTKEVVSELIALKVALFSILVITASPVLLLYVLSSQEKGIIWCYTIPILIILSLIWFFIKSIRLFISKKIPILQWFLYLCCVEFIPISCIGVIITRY